MKLILGQGNPGKQYAKTRHNIGFMALDHLAKQHGLSWQLKPKWQAEIAEGSLHGQKFLLIKPTCFYNLTGQVLRQISDFYKINFSEDILVIHDDLAIELGTIRIRSTGSDGGNNGLKSIISHIGSKFWRLRIGTKTPLIEKMDNANFALSKITFREKLQLKTLLSEVSRQTDTFLTEQLTETSLK